MKKTKFIAHKRQADGADQSVYEHLQEVGDLAEKFARKVGLEGAGRLIGLLHDFGKYSSQFQHYIKSATGDYDKDDEDYVDASLLKGKVDHSSAGAQWLWDKMKVVGGAGQGELCSQILSLCIASHHSGLIDCVNRNDELVFCERMAKSEAKTHVSECAASADKELIEQVEALADVGLVKELFGKLQCLVDFDRGRREDFTVAVFFKIVDTVSVFKRRLSLPQAFPDSVSLAQRARNF